VGNTAVCERETELLIGCGGGKEAERISRQRFSGLKNTEC